MKHTDDDNSDSQHMLKYFKSQDHLREKRMKKRERACKEYLESKEEEMPKEKRFQL